MNIILSLSSGILSYRSYSNSVAYIVNHYVQNDKLAKNAQISAEQAEEAYPRLVKNLLSELAHEDIDAKIIEYKGYKHNLDDTMTSAFEGKVPSQLTHAVIQVGQMAIDICRLRMGNNYELPLSYPIKEALRYWAVMVDRTHLAKMTSEDVKHRVRQAQDTFRKGGHILDFDNKGAEGTLA